MILTQNLEITKLSHFRNKKEYFKQSREKMTDLISTLILEIIEILE